MFLSEIFITLLLIGFINAAVLRTPQRRATQSCRAKDHGVFSSYAVWIGIPYDVNNCPNAYNHLEYDVYPDTSTNCEPTSWQCVKATDGNTQLYFNAPTGWSLCINH